MNTKKIFKGKLGKAAPLALFLLMGNQLLADTSANAKPESGVTVLEIMGYVAMIIGIILLAWFIGSMQSRPNAKPGPTDYQGHARKQFNHPNDPHFRKLKRKTS